ncbi:MAG TPA: hypothetical protein VKC11_00325 [Steroidobacteraceae bacterium]|nr:hypothetical protein [Steroidobacteraceae bacterium]
MGAREFARTLFDGGSAWAAGGALSLTAALIDLHSATRWPYGISMFMIAFILSCLRPKWVWRWAFLAALALPAYVVASNHWGPYAVDRLDVLYGLLPAAAGTLAAITWGKARNWTNRASH